MGLNKHRKVTYDENCCTIYAGVNIQVTGAGVSWDTCTKFTGVSIPWTGAGVSWDTFTVYTEINIP